MKTERRHELQGNWLADRVNAIIFIAKPYMKGVVGLLLAVVVLWGTFLYLSHRSAVEEASGWNKLWFGLLSQANSVEELQLLSESSPNQPMGEWAQLLLADNDLSMGVGQLFTDKAAGHDRINTALQGYDSVLKNSTDSLVREHALYGIGRTQESLGKLSEAEKAYEQLRKEFPTGVYFARAKERLDDLARPETRARYDWLAKLEPPANVFKKGTDADKGLPPELEPFSQFSNPSSKTLPPDPKPDTGATAPKDSKAGDVKPTDVKPADSKAPDAKTPEKTKATDKAPDTKPSDTKPSDTKPSDTKPSDTKPSDTKPSDTKPSDTKPSDTKATDSKASDTKPASSPAETAPKPDDSKAAPPKPADSK